MTTVRRQLTLVERLRNLERDRPAGAAPGSSGNPGTPGTAASVTVGTTTTGAAGSDASVTNSGSSSAAVLNFTVPRGATGSPGTNGTNGSNGAAATVAVGTTTTGAAGSNASVTNSGTSSAAVLNFTVPQGPKGDPGTTGSNGAAATVAVGTTTTGAAGSNASVTNSGTSSAAVLNFTVPQGAGGAGLTISNTVRSSAYTALANEVVMTSGSPVITLPTGIAAGTQVIVHRTDDVGAALTYPTVRAGASQTIEGYTNIYLYYYYASITLVWDGSSKWRVADCNGFWANGFRVPGVMPPPGTVLYDFSKSAAQSINSGAWTVIALDGNNTGIYGSVSGQVFAAPWAGDYEFSGMVALAQNSTGVRNGGVGQGATSGTTIGAVNGAVSLAANTAFATVCVTPPTILTLAAGETVGLCGYQNSGAALALSAGAVYGCRMIAKFCTV